MIGTIINVITVIVGSLIGMVFRSKVPKRLVDISFIGIGIFTLVLGIRMATQSEEILFLIFSIIIGGIIGELLDIDKGLTNIGEWIKTKLKSDNARFTDGLITSFLLFCMGALTIMGAIEAGINGNIDLLLTKSIMDGFAALALASTLGIGVLFSVIPLLLYQGALTLLAGSLQAYLTDPMIRELSAVGGILLIGLALNILEIKKIKISNMLPSLVVILIFMLFKA